MYINRLEIKGFGNFKDRTVKLSRGINILYGCNEAGKTTLQWYIRAMLYGLKNTRQTKNGAISPQKRFEPWFGGRYGGTMEYTLDDGSSYRVERDFKNGTVQLFDSGFKDITGSFETGKDKMPLFAEKQLGLDEAAFERTVLIRQSEIGLDDVGAGVLAERLANVRNTGAEDVSFSRAEKALTDALRNKVGTGRTTTQPLDKLEARLKQLEAEESELTRRKERRLATVQELQEVRKKKLRLRKEKEFLDWAGRLTGIRRSLDQGLKEEAALREELKRLKDPGYAVTGNYIDRTPSLGGEAAGDKQDMQNAPDKRDRRDATDELGMWDRHDTQDRRLRRYLPLCLTAAAVSAAALVYKIAAGEAYPAWHFIVAGAGMLLSAGLALYLAYGIRKAPDAGNTDLNEEETRAVQARLDTISAELDRLSAELDEGIAEAGRVGCENSGAINKFNIETLLYDREPDELEKLVTAETEKAKDKLLEAALREKYCEGLLNDASEENGKLQQVEEESFALGEKIMSLRRSGEALELALEVFREAAEEIKREFTPGLNKRMSGAIKGLTGRRYEDLRSDDRLALKVAVPESGDIKSVLSLSGAAVDQMYLALRLSMAELLTAGGERPPLLMDEIFSQFDDKNTAYALEYLYNTYGESQVLIFTCKKREAELAERICGTKRSLVEL